MKNNGVVRKAVVYTIYFIRRDLLSTKSSWTPKSQPSDSRAAVWLSFWGSTKPSAGFITCISREPIWTSKTQPNGIFAVVLLSFWFSTRFVLNKNPFSNGRVSAGTQRRSSGMVWVATGISICKSKPFKVENNTWKIPKQLQNNFEKVQKKWPLKTTKMSQFLTQNLNFRGRLSTIGDENTPKSRP